MSAEPGELAATMRQWARAAKGTAAQNKAKCDRYGVQLAEARARVYSEAADLVDAQGADDLAAVARVMIDRAGVLAVRTPPLRDFDPAGVRYVAARAWQLCAQTLDPEIPVAQEPWP